MPTSRIKSKLKNRLTGPFVFILVFTVSLIIPGSVLGDAATEQERVKTLIEGAKKEANLFFYTGWNFNVAGSMLRVFEKKYPFIKGRLYRTGSSKMITKVLAERRAKKYIPDVISIAGFEGYLLKKAGASAQYYSPEMKYFPDGYKDPEGHWTSLALNPCVMVYNTRLVKPEEVPKNYEDLLDPKWKGQMSMDTADYEWYAMQKKILGPERAMNLLKGLAIQDIMFRRGRTLQIQLVAAGEFALAVNVYGPEVQTAMKEGAPVNWVGVEPVLAKLHPIMLVDKAPHPNAAKLFIDFMLSKQGQELTIAANKVSIRKGLPMALIGLEKLEMITSDLSLAGKYPEFMKEYRQLLQINK